MVLTLASIRRTVVHLQGLGLWVPVLSALVTAGFAMRFMDDLFSPAFLRLELVSFVGGLTFESSRKRVRHGRHASWRVAGLLIPIAFLLGAVHIWVESWSRAGTEAWKVVSPLILALVAGLAAGGIGKNLDLERQRQKRIALGDRLERDEKRAVAAANLAGQRLSVKEVLERERRVLESLFLLSDGEAGKRVQLRLLARRSVLSTAQTKAIINRLEREGLVEVTDYHWSYFGEEKNGGPKHWTDQHVSMKAKGNSQVKLRHDANRVSNVSNFHFTGPVTAGSIGDYNTIRQLRITGQVEAGEAFQHLLGAVRHVEERLADPQQVSALRDELSILESDEPEGVKTAAVQRLVGMSRLLGSVADPILDAANKVKDLLG